MKFSLVMGTMGRTKELELFLDSLKRQNYRDCELIVVDQNPDDRLVPILAPYYEFFTINHLRSEPGLSRARNVGLKHVSGEIVAFPDDDCQYPPDLLKRIADFLEKHPQWQGLTGRSVDETTNTSAGRFDTEPGRVNKFNVWSRGISFTVFLRKEVAASIEGFDESLGVGAGTLWVSGEETDYLLQALEAGFKIYYDPNVVVTHPSPTSIYSRPVFQRALKYGAGMGKVLRKYNYPLWFLLRALIRPAGGTLIAFMTAKPGKALYHWNVFRGRLIGLFKPK